MDNSKNEPKSDDTSEEAALEACEAESVKRRIEIWQKKDVFIRYHCEM